MSIDLANFSNPWEHVRLLSDAARNQALLTVLGRHAPGARVLEVGCGTGLLSCVAARMGARRVYAVEPTELVEQASELVRANGLSDVVEVVEGRVEDLEPRPVDLVFSELLNADPFAEGVMPAMSAARRWLVDGGRVCPVRLRVFAALVREGESAREVRMAREAVAHLAERHHLDLRLLDGLLAEPGPYVYVDHVRETVGDPVQVWDLDIGVDDEPDDPIDITLTARQAGAVGGVVVWFEAVLDDGVVLNNAPGCGGHWGQLVCGWPAAVGLSRGGSLRVRVDPGDDGVVVVPLGARGR